jgi:hypothetical protein
MSSSKKTYFASNDGTVLVKAGKEEYCLSSRLDLRNHSPSGFAWGYGGSGPAQLALAICADAYGDEWALRNYQNFKRNFVATLDAFAAWSITEDEVRSLAERETKT